MDDAILQELTTLIQETEKLLAHVEPDLERWESYSSTRQQLFARLEAVGSFAVYGEKEQATLQRLVQHLLNQDELLKEKLRADLSRCREELCGISKARTVLRGYTPPRPSPLLERHA